MLTTLWKYFGEYFKEYFGEFFGEYLDEHDGWKRKALFKDQRPNIRSNVDNIRGIF